MSDESACVLSVINDELLKHDAKTVGRLELLPDRLTAFDGQMVLHVEVRNDADVHPSIAHCHVIAVIGRTSLSDPLDACVMGMDDDRQKALAGAARSWVSNVGSVLFSLLHAAPVMNARHFDGQDAWGVPGCHGFVGPIYGYGMKGLEDPATLAHEGLFEYAEAMAAPGIVHLAKVILQAAGPQGWTRSLEIDGHQASYEDKNWTCRIPAPASGIASQFSVFHYGAQHAEVEARQKLDDTIRQFVAAVGQIKDIEAAMNQLRERGADPFTLDRVFYFAPSAFFQVVFAQMQLRLSPDYCLVKKDGTCEKRKLMREPAFARSLALCPQFIKGDRIEGVKMLATYSSTFNVLNSALNAGSKPENLVFSPTFIPDAGTRPEIVEQAARQASMRPGPKVAGKEKPWWRLW